jgi:hypothetical protein
MRKFRGWSLVFSTALLSTFGTATLRAQSNQLTLTDEPAAPITAPAIAEIATPEAQAPILTAFGKTPMRAIPVSTGAITQGQTPRAIASSQLNLSAIPRPASLAPASYNEMPYGQSPLAPPAMGPPGMGMPGMGPPGMPGGGYPMQAGFGGGGDPGMMMGGPMEMSGEYSGGMEGMEGGEYGGGFCPACGGQGCENCCYGGEFGDGVIAGFLRRLLPYAEGGRCAPRWYDITLDSMYVQRDSVGQQVNFTTFTRLAFGGQVVLSTANLDYEEEMGMRFTGALQILPGHALEFSYYGLFNWASVATVSDPTNNLFSVYSGFGENPINGFDETDQSQFQSLRSSSTIDSFEINFRKRNTAPNCRLQWSTMWGARYVYLLDDLEFFTLGRNVAGASVGQSDSDVRARNSLTGFQVGGDLWSTIIPGVSIGTELKGGVYGNYAKQNTSVVSINNAIGNPAPVFEATTNNDIAFVGEGSITFIYKTSPNWTARFGYNFVYIDGVALAADNFNTQNPFGIGRTAQQVDDNSDVLLHGGFAGFEWMW